MVTVLILQVSLLVGDAESKNDVVVENAYSPTVLWKWVLLWKEGWGAVRWGAFT